MRCCDDGCSHMAGRRIGSARMIVTLIRRLLRAQDHDVEVPRIVLGRLSADAGGCKNWHNVPSAQHGTAHHVLVCGCAVACVVSESALGPGWLWPGVTWLSHEPLRLL